MTITLKLFASLVRRVSGRMKELSCSEVVAGRPLLLEIPENSTVQDLVNLIELSPTEVKVIYINARAQRINYTLRAGDEVGIFPLVGGG
jgi:molybdopterin converting factor small subunit